MFPRLRLRSLWALGTAFSTVSATAAAFATADAFSMFSSSRSESADAFATLSAAALSTAHSIGLKHTSSSVTPNR